MAAKIILNKNYPIKWGIITRVVMVFTFVFVVTSCELINKNKKPQLDLTKLQLKEDIIAFTFYKVRKIYSGLVKLDNQIVLIDKELERLKEIEAEYPKQKKIIITERKIWKKVKKNLQTSLSNLEKEVEKIYVTYSVNKNKGIELINKNTKSLVNDIGKALEASRPHTKRLIVVVKKSFIDIFKAKLFG